MDKALKRNLEKQTPKTQIKTQEENISEEQIVE